MEIVGRRRLCRPLDVGRAGRRRGSGDILTLSRRRLNDVGDILSMREAVSEMRKMAGSADWREDYLLIPDRPLRNWVKTHPIQQIIWTEGKNGRTQGHYVNVVNGLWPGVKRRWNSPSRHLVSTLTCRMVATTSGKW
jgi:hypothetical protein